MENSLRQTIQIFADWARLKLRIHLKEESRSVYFKERQIWWTSLGQNIGNERNGKHDNFERPVLILKKFNAEMFLAVPISTKIKPGEYRYVFVRNGGVYTANLSQVRTLSSKRLLRRQSGNIEEIDYERIKQIFKNLV